MRMQFFSAGSACVGNFLAQAQHAQKKMANICRSLRKKNKNFSSPQVTYPYRIYWCKKNGSKISHLGTFNVGNALNPVSEPPGGQPAWRCPPTIHPQLCNVAGQCPPELNLKKRRSRGWAHGFLRVVAGLSDRAAWYPVVSIGMGIAQWPTACPSRPPRPPPGSPAEPV